MRNRPAHRPKVPHQRIRDPRRGGRDRAKRKIGARDVGMTNKRADAQMPVHALDRVKPRNAIDVNELRRRSKPRLHHRDQALTAGKEANLVAAFGLSRHGFLNRTGCDIVERGRKHGVTSSHMEVKRNLHRPIRSSTCARFGRIAERRAHRDIVVPRVDVACSRQVHRQPRDARPVHVRRSSTPPCRRVALAGSRRRRRRIRTGDQYRSRTACRPSRNCQPVD